jgi:hypothetical protein
MEAARVLWNAGSARWRRGGGGTLDRLIWSRIRARADRNSPTTALPSNGGTNTPRAPSWIDFTRSVSAPLSAMAIDPIGGPPGRSFSHGTASRSTSGRATSTS